MLKERFDFVSNGSCRPHGQRHWAVSTWLLEVSAESLAEVSLNSK